MFERKILVVKRGHNKVCLGEVSTHTQEANSLGLIISTVTEQKS
jgi:hypothetical protein